MLRLLPLLFGCAGVPPGPGPDSGCAVSSFIDNDRDGHGTGDPQPACGEGDGYAEVGDDCDDRDATVHPGAEETCDRVDQDCDGEVDEGAVDATSWYADVDADTYGNASVATKACSAPAASVGDATDCDDTDGSVHPGAEETCDGQDDDCDGAVDEDAADADTWYADDDDDGYGDASVALPSCAAPEGFVEDPADCDDTDPRIHPGTDETCDEKDQDCDGVIDEDALDATVWYADADGDGYGDADDLVAACAPPDGYVPDAADCDDSDDLAFPGAAELCDDRDQDCDGELDEDAVDATTWSADADSDGYGDPTVLTTACDAPTGYVSDGTDCDDLDELVYPGASEYCDDVDQDCDGDSYDNGTCAELQDLEAIAEGTWEGDTGTYGTVFWPTLVGDQDEDGADDLILTASKESDVSPGSDFGGMFFVPGGQSVHRGMTKDELATVVWEGDVIHDPLFAAWDAGDVDGDGSRDLWLGTSAYDGMASLLLGPASRWGTGGSAADVADVSWYGENYRDNFPYSNAETNEDLDADGFADAVFLTTSSGDPDYSADCAVYILFGRADVADDSSRSPADEVRLDAYNASDIAAGDLDGDGVEDLIVNGPDVIYLLDGALTRDASGLEVADLAAATVVPDLSSGSGSSLAEYFDVVGDWTGDGIADWAAADSRRPATTREGTVYLVAGGTDALDAGEQGIDEAAEGSWVGDGPYPDRIGVYAAAAVEDVDGDGTPEISTGWVTQWLGSQDLAALVLLSGEGVPGTASAVPDRALRLAGGDAAEGAGWRIVSGDFDGDGLTDLGAGSLEWNGQSGRSYLLFGSAIPWSDASAW